MKTIRARMVFLVATLAAVTLTAGAAEPQDLPEEVRREVREPASLPAGRYRLLHAWQAEGPDLRHQTGRAVEDPAAESGRAWEGTVPGGSGLPGPAGQPEGQRPGCLLFGPYLEVPAGPCVAFFRLALVGKPEESAVGRLDAVVRFAEQVLAVRELVAADLAPGRYTQVPLPFLCTPGRLECRLDWAGSVSVRVDSVRLFGLEGGTVRPDAGMVALPQPSGEPAGLVYRPEQTRPFAELFPRSAEPSGRLAVVDLRPLPPDWRFLLVSLQGLVNRTAPAAYCLHSDLDARWLDWLRQRGWTGEPEPLGAEAFVARFRDRCRGAVIPDPALPATRNVATMLAAVEDNVVASPRIVEFLKLPVTADLRGRWTTSLDAYRWAFDTLWPRLTHGPAACLWPDAVQLRDYLVQHRLPVFWLPGRIDGAAATCRPAEEVRLVEELLARLPPNSPLLGYPYAGKDVGLGEGPGVTLFAEYAKYLVGSVGNSNLSVHTGVRRAPGRVPAAPPPPALARDAVYVAIIISDGDNLPVLSEGNFPQLWDDPLRGTLPLGWTLSPAASQLIPGIVAHYLATATPNDAFLGAVSGIGYTYPDSYATRYRPEDRAAAFDGFLAQTAAGLEASGLHQAWIMNATRPELIRRYAEQIPTLDAIFPDYGRRVTSYDQATYPTVRNVGVFHAASGWTEGASREELIAGVVQHIRSMTPSERPAFLHLFVWNWGFNLGMLREVMTRLGPPYVTVRPDHLATLFRQDLADRRLLPRLPAQVVAVEGLPLRLDGTVHNGTDAAVTASVRVSGGLREVRGLASPVTLPAGQATALSVEGLPDGTPIGLEWTGNAVRQTASVPCRALPRTEIVGALPPDLGALRFAARYDAVDLSHRVGAAADDPAALAGRVWAIRPGVDAPGHLTFGPYAPLPAGRYLALFRLRRLAPGGTGLVVTVDTCVGGGTPTTARHDVRAEDLPATGFACVPLEFRHPGGPVEARTLWHGGTPVALDTVCVWRLD